MSEWKDAVFRFIRQYPSVSIILMLIFIMNIVANLFGTNLIGANTADPSYRNWFLLVVSIFLAKESFSTILLILALFMLGVNLEKIYGSVKFMMLFLLSGIISGGIVLYLADSMLIYGSLITISCFLGVFYALILNQNRLALMTNRNILWLTLGVLFSASVITDFTGIEMLTGIVIGFVLSLVVKPQTFRDMVKTRFKQSVSRSVVIVAIAFSVLYFPRFIESNVVQETVEVIDFDKLAQFNHGVNPERMHFEENTGTEDE